MQNGTRPARNVPVTNTHFTGNHSFNVDRKYATRQRRNSYVENMNKKYVSNILITTIKVMKLGENYGYGIISLYKTESLI